MRVSETRTTETTVTLQSQSVFHLTGSRTGDELESVEDGRFRPALLACYRDLTALRYDYPVVLVEEGPSGELVRSLSSVVDGVLQEVAPRGVEGERLRRQALRLERELRTIVRDGSKGMLSDLWDKAAASLASDGDESLEQVLRHTGGQITLDGEVVDCDHDVAARIVEHAWRRTQKEKARRFHEEVHRLVQALSDILRAAFIHSEGGRQPESLRAGVGDLHHDQFDFDAMSRLLGKGAPKDELPPERRERIESALAVLQHQRFFEPPAGAGLAQTTEAPYEYRFPSCAEMLMAFRERLPEVVEFVKAMSVADLEADGRYVEAKHDPFFRGFGEDALTPEDLALFPDYLVSIDSSHTDAAESGALMEVLSSDLPVKVLVQTEDVLEEPSVGAGHFGFGMRSVQLASTALGLHDVFILQTTSSNLYQLRDRLAHGLEYAGPALFSVFSGSKDPASNLPPYLTAAAAMESRAFVAFTYDPSAGSDWASRFSLEDNPQPELDWPIEDFEYADESLQRVREQVPFTVVDFIVCDRRYARHFARVPRSGWNENTVPVDEWLALDAKDVGERVPHISVVDEDDVLHRLIVDAKLMQAARRYREIWHGLQELGGVHNSHAERLLERERAAWEEQKERELASARAEAAALPAVVEHTEGGTAPVVLGEPLPAEVAPSPEAESAVAEAAEPVAEEAPAPLGDPWIETSRCSTCNECTAINDRMFAYDENKQAYFKDMDAGTFREIVEAAEACQVAVIHPGKPRNPNEPGLDELIERAKPFQ
jgi:hypothetical protein